MLDIIRVFLNSMIMVYYTVWLWLTEWYALYSFTLWESLWWHRTWVAPTGMVVYVLGPKVHRVVQHYVVFHQWSLRYLTASRPDGYIWLGLVRYKFQNLVIVEASHGVMPTTSSNWSPNRSLMGCEHKTEELFRFSGTTIFLPTHGKSATSPRHWFGKQDAIFDV
jgi:hypothetical protein